VRCAPYCMRTPVEEEEFFLSFVPSTWPLVAKYSQKQPNTLKSRIPEVLLGKYIDWNERGGLEGRWETYDEKHDRMSSSISPYEVLGYRLSQRFGGNITYNVIGQYSHSTLEWERSGPRHSGGGSH